MAAVYQAFEERETPQWALNTEIAAWKADPASSAEHCPRPAGYVM
jgi:hypothetical protein